MSSEPRLAEFLRVTSDGPEGIRFVSLEADVRTESYFRLEHHRGAITVTYLLCYPLFGFELLRR